MKMKLNKLEIGKLLKEKSGKLSKITVISKSEVWKKKLELKGELLVCFSKNSNTCLTKAYDS